MLIMPWALASSRIFASEGSFKTISAKKRREELKNLIADAEKLADRNKIDQLTREFQQLQTRGGIE